uniref:C2H2-type domain-containing protein n=2 Tax=Photinus pyralis TaxID=7054 RepID=A0A1Y1KRC1_PHOPY
MGRGGPRGGRGMGMMRGRYIFMCPVCGTTFNKQCNLSRHARNVHNSSLGERKKTLACPLCSDLCVTYHDLDQHIQSTHSIKIVEEQLIFNGPQEFQEWKDKIESETLANYRVMSSCVKKKKSLRITKYICHRSGKISKYKEDPRQRAPKVKGSNKINSNCPARIIYTEKKGKVKVSFFGTHVGHAQDIDRLRIPNPEREAIAAKLIQGISPKHILREIGKEFDPTKRISYTTNRDIHNIKQSLKIPLNNIFDYDDASSVDSLISKLKPLVQDSAGNPILSYKPYGVEDEDIGTNNFFLVFMNPAQSELLNIYGGDILMIDSTHAGNPYKVQLTTLMVIDENSEGFPVAFLWSIMQTEVIFKHFFTAIKKRVPNIAPKSFMSDDTNTFYSAFTSVFGHRPNKLMCDWHVKKKLFESLSKISSAEKKKYVKSSLQSLINEVDAGKFQKILPIFIESLLEDPDTEKFGGYFSKYYSNRTEQWANCLRKQFHKNTSMALGKWYRELKHNASLGEKRQQSLDNSIQNVLQCLRQKFLKGLILHNKVPHTLQLIRKRHQVACTFLNQVDIQRESDTTFSIACWRKDGMLLENYHVAVLVEQEQCKCAFLCAECNKCLHMLSCTCNDYNVQYNMCVHQHLVCLKYFDALPHENEVQLVETFNDENSNSEYEDGYEHNISMRHSPEPMLDCQELEVEKIAALEKCHALINEISNCQSVAAVSYAVTNLNTIILGINEIEKTVATTAFHSDKKLN